MKKIELTGGYFALVDDEYFERINLFKWYADVKKHSVYARRKIKVNNKWTSIGMHNVIIGALNIDHKDHNGLNNMKSNLRACSALENARNRSSSKKSKSIYLGVHPSNRKLNPWRAMIKLNGKSKSIGNFKNEEEAAFAYNKVASKYYGEFANLNKIMKAA